MNARLLSGTSLLTAILFSLACTGLTGSEPSTSGGPSGSSGPSGTRTTRIQGDIQQPDPNDPNNYALPPVNQRPADCEDPIETPRPNGCVSARINCGDTVKGNTSFGQANFDDEFYVHNFCTPQRHDYDDAREIKYLITVPGDKKATFTLESPCGDLDISAMGWDNPNACPGKNARRLNECEMRPRFTDTESVSVATVTNAQNFLIAIDGKNGMEANYTLSVECVDYR